MYKLKNFPVSTGHICIMSCVADIFNYYNLEVNESIIFTVSEASLFYYRHFDIEEELNKNGTLELFDLKMGGMEYDIPLLIKNITEFFNIKTEAQSSFNRSDIKDFISGHLNRNHPIFSLLSRKFLKYMNKNLRDNITHSVNIYGYDFAENKLYISDTFIPTIPVKVYQGAVDFNNYYNSLTASRDIFNKDFAFRNISFIPGETISFINLSPATMLQPLKNTALKFLEGEGSLEDGILTGIKGFEQLINDYVEWTESEITPLHSKLMKIIHHRLTNFGGPVITNKLLAEYVEYINNIEFSSGHQIIIDKFMGLSRNWLIIANLFFKASFGKMDQIKTRLYNRLIDITHEEEGLYRKIAKL